MSPSEVIIEYTIKRLRQESVPLLNAKFRRHLARRLADKQQGVILDLSLDMGRLEETPVHENVDAYTT
jgi:2-methylcitrate dehydratase